MKTGRSLFILLVLITLTAVAFLGFYGRGLKRSNTADRDSKTRRLPYSDSAVAISKLPKKSQILTVDGSPRYKDSNSTLEPSKQQILKKNYMFSFWYAEQLTMSTAHLIQLLNLAVGWNFTGVVPYVLKSDMFGVRLKDKPSQEYVKFSLLFNVSNLNYELASCHNRTSDSDVFESMSQFLNHSYRDITTVYFSKHWAAFSQSINNAMDGGVKYGGEPIVDCTATARKRGLSKKVEEKLNKELQSWSNEEHEGRSTDKQPFRVVQTFCVHKTLPLTLAQMMDYIDRHIKQRVRPNGIRERLTSVVLVTWQGRFTRKFEDLDTMNKCSLPHEYTKIGHSNTVKQTALQFVESLGLQKNSFLSIHVRFEKLFFHAPKSSERLYWQCVVKKLNSLIDEVRHTHNLPSTAALLMTDYGTYGSETCGYKGGYTSKATCLKEAKRLQSLLSVPKTEFDPTKLKLPRNSGFVSLVESESILLGKALITVGRGSYQKSIVERFLLTHESNCVYRIAGANDDCEKS